MPKTTNERALTLEQIKRLSDAELCEFQLHYKEVIGFIETKVEGVKASGDEANHTLRAALRHFRTALGFIKDVRKERNRNTSARLHSELYKAVGAFLEDDGDENYQRLCAAHAAMVPAFEGVA